MEQSSLGEFFNYLYGSEEGSVYVATKSPDTFDWTKNWFQWPVQKTALVEFVKTKRNSAEVYMAPALFSSPDKATKANVQGSTVVWVEFDGIIPTDLQGIAEPTMRVRSSGAQNEHWYWKLDRVIGPDEIEKINRSLTYKLGADHSGWDCTQVLRPPETFNHKKKKETSLISMTQDLKLSPELFASISAPPPVIATPIPENIASAEVALLKYAFSDRAREIFLKGKNDRSSGLMELGYLCAEMGMHPEEMIAVLLNLDKRVKKFDGRTDQLHQLMHIITLAKTKHPTSAHQITKNEDDIDFSHVSINEILAYNIDIKWRMESLLSNNGFLLLTGSPGVGKTQFSLNAATHMVLGKDFLGFKTHPSRIGFLSLEMGGQELKSFLGPQMESFTQEEQDILQQRLLIMPVGEPVQLTMEKRLAILEQKISAENLDGIIIDSLGASTNDSLNDESMREILNRIKSAFRKRNCFIWFIHHNRKANGENKKPNKLSDVYGSQFITAVPDTVLSLHPGIGVDVIEVRPLKVRLAACPPVFLIKRTASLNFLRLTAQEPPEIVAESPSTEGVAPFSAEPGASASTPLESGVVANGQDSSIDFDQ